MVEKAAWWDWPTFWPAFWAGFGRMVAGASVLCVGTAMYLGTGSADFESAVIGWAILLIVSAIYGWSEGDAAVREWRYSRTVSPPQ